MKKCFLSGFVLAPLMVSGLSGCVNTQYTPGLYNIAPEKIQPLSVKGNIEYLNNYKADTPGVVDEQGNKYSFSYQQVTDAFNRQLKNEISQREQNNTISVVKTIGSKVKHINCAASFGSYVRRCQFTVEVTTGDGQVILIEASQGSPIFNSMNGSLDGTIATGVIKALENKKLLTYIEAESVSTAAPTPVMPLKSETLSTAGVQDTPKVESTFTMSSTEGSQPTNNFDLSGTYVSEITHKDLPSYLEPRNYFGQGTSVKVIIEQNENSVTGKISGDRRGEIINGTIIGNKITFEWFLVGVGSSKEGKGAWVISNDPFKLNGSWRTHLGSKGIWNLTKIE